MEIPNLEECIDYWFEWINRSGNVRSKTPEHVAFVRSKFLILKDNDVWDEFYAHFLITDDPIDPKKAMSQTELKTVEKYFQSLQKT